MIKENDIKYLAEERVHNTVNGFLRKIKDLKETAKSPSSKILSNANEKSARFLDDVNPLFTGKMVVKAGHQLDQVREEMFDYLHLDMDDHILNQEDINGPEDTIEDIFEGVLGTADSPMSKGFYHYEMLLRKLNDLDYEYRDLWNLDDLKRETKVLMGVTKAWDKEAHKLHAEMEDESVARHMHLLTKTVADLIPEGEAMHPKFFAVKFPLDKPEFSSPIEEQLTYLRALNRQYRNSENWAKLNDDEEGVKRAQKSLSELEEYAISLEDKDVK